MVLALKGFKEKENNDWKIKAITNSLPSLRWYQGQHDKTSTEQLFLPRTEHNSLLIVSLLSALFLSGEISSPPSALPPRPTIYTPLSILKSAQVVDGNSLAFYSFSFA